MSVESSLRRIVRQLDEFERLLDLHSVRHEKLSGWSISNHVEHSINVTEGVFKRLAEGEAGSTPGKPLSLIGRVILFIGLIPRGRGKAPKQTQPSDAPVDDLRLRLTRLRRAARAHLESPAALKSTPAVFPHPYFGLLRGPQWVRFVEIHQHHHLKIMRDIASASLR